MTPPASPYAAGVLAPKKTIEKAVSIVMGTEASSGVGSAPPYFSAALSDAVRYVLTKARAVKRVPMAAQVREMEAGMGPVSQLAATSATAGSTSKARARTRSEGAATSCGRVQSAMPVAGVRRVRGPAVELTRDAQRVAGDVDDAQSRAISR